MVKMYCFFIIDSNIAHKKHGPTRCIKRVKKNRYGRLMSLTISKNAMQFVGQNFNAITIEIGCVIIKNIHLEVKT